MTDSPATPTPEELEALVVGDPDNATPFALPTVASGAPVLHMLERELRAAARAEIPGSPLQAALERVLSGQTGLRDLLADPAFPTVASAAPTAPGSAPTGTVEAPPEDEDEER